MVLFLEQLPNDNMQDHLEIRIMQIIHNTTLSFDFIQCILMSAYVALMCHTIVLIILHFTAGVLRTT